jgi:nitrate/nitrite-specific signal transduction histidine kinase
MGLKIMQYRAKQLDAQLDIIARSEGGTEVRLEKRIG